MARPHIDFLQSQALPWRHGLYGGGRPDVETKILSFDKENGDSSLLVRYPTGWSQAEPGHLLADEELFVLDGALEINGIAYTKHCYAHLPAGYLRRTASSEGGTVLLTFFSAEPRMAAGEAPNGLYDESRLVEYVSTFESELSSDFTVLGAPAAPELASSAFILFREDPYDHDQTWLLCTKPLSKLGIIEVHPVVEELYQVSGEKASGRGLMGPGGYFWRPPGIAHGPIGTRTGSMGLFRSKGGPLRTDVAIAKGQFDWTPPMRAALPPDLEKYRPDGRRAAGRY